MESVSTIFGFIPEFRTFKGSKNLVDSVSNIGIEIELENWLGDNKLRNALRPYWNWHHDDSLRGNCIELNFSVPMKGADVIQALTVLEKNIKKLKEPPILSTRTSTHVHIDTSDIDKKQLFNWFILYIILERVIYKYVGDRRERSIFCVPFYKADKNIKVLNTFIQEQLDPDDIKHILGKVFNNQTRYAGLNLHSLFKFGTLEFRMLEGEYRKDKLTEWLNILLCIKNYAKDVESSLPDLNIHISEVGIDIFLTEVFGQLVPKLIYDDIGVDIIKGVRLAQDIIHDKESNNMYWDLLTLGNKISLGRDLRDNFKKKTGKKEEQDEIYMDKGIKVPKPFNPEKFLEEYNLHPKPAQWAIIDEGEDEEEVF